MIFKSSIQTVVSSFAVAMTVLIVTSASMASALTLDFEFLAHGEIAIGSFDGVTISASNPNRRDFDLAVGFDSRAHETLGITSDPDLQAGGIAMPWSGGNIANQELGTFLILQENNRGCADNICNDPDDEGRRPAGVLSFDFLVPVQDFGFDAIDIESVTAENAFILFVGGGGTATLNLMDFLTAGADLYDPTLELGNNTANRFAPVTAAFLGLSQIERVDFRLGGSGGLDNIVSTPVPEPTSGLLMGLGLAALAVHRRNTGSAAA